ncbi:MAG: DnaJ C-terminal domain-containing protein [Bdellovibrionota bacterium]
MDPYKTLGVKKSASAEEIKNAYRALAKKFHPDLNPGNKSAEHKFKDINGAYEILGTPENRAKFDRGEWGEEAGAHTQRRHGGPFYRETRAGGAGGHYARGFEGGFDEDIFADLFGARGGRGNFKMPGQDETYKMEIPLVEAVRGGEHEIHLPSGKHLRVKIPPGVISGQKLRFAGQGQPGIGGGPPGDVFVEIVVETDARFSAEGAHLVHDLAVPLDVAVLGGEVTVPTPEGQVRLKVPPHSNSGRRLRIPKKGMFAKGGRGDLFVELKIVLPDPPDAELEALIKEWRAAKERRAS